MRKLAFAPGLAGRNRALKQAVHHNRAASRQGVLERLFTLSFGGLVYPQIWEDPVIDMAALEIGRDDQIVAIASGGCNILSYLTANPARITAVDLNPAHIALVELKLAALRHLPGQSAFHRFFANAHDAANPALFDQFLKPHLSDKARRYWTGTAGLGRKRRIEQFAHGFYRHGLLGRFIGLGHALARVYGVEPAELTEQHSLAAQRAFFDGHLKPLFDKRFVRWLTANTASLYGLGIPPAQYHALAGGRHMADVLCERLERLACGFPLDRNYFAWQAFGRCYAPDAKASLPPYLEPDQFDHLRARAGHIDLQHRSITDVLAERPAQSVDCVVLLDAQDWMNDGQLDALWRAITHAARPGARVIFRTAAEPDLLPGRVDPGLLAQWAYRADRAGELTRRDRSSIYGGFHIYRRAG